ncbi:MAG: tripartite tricarboxylate transporter substrate binding protein [Acetobacteraceae bacterium]|nr:tripartite tricarboxylate transporter substrate binding protein [Acetobacteraceae bacterium]
MNTIPRRRAVAALGAFTSLGVTVQAGEAGAQQQAWPDQPIRLIVPFPPGGPADTIARLIAPGIGEHLGGRSVVVESRSGAGGIVGIEAVARSRPDGHTIGLASSGVMAILPGLQANMPFNPERDLAKIGLVLSVPQILAVSPSLPVRSVSELVALARQRPGEISYGSSGIGNTLHLAAEMFRVRAGGIDIVHVPYRGAAQAIPDLLSGRLQMMFADVPILLPHVRSGALRALGVTAQERLELLPELPTMIEAGIPGMISASSYGLVAPAGVPAERIAALNAALNASLAVPETRRALIEQGGLLRPGTPAEAAAFFQGEMETWREIARIANIRLE